MNREITGVDIAEKSPMVASIDADRGGVRIGHRPADVGMTA
jgi:hypothetical protein